MSTWSNMLDRLYHRDAKHITPHEQQEIDRFMNAPINSTRVIGIGGRLRSGKDTVADYLVEQHGFVKVWMSKPLDDAMKILNPIIEQDPHADVTYRYRELRENHDYTSAKKNPEVRRFLQVLGTDFGRKMIHEDVWVDMAADNIQDVLDSGYSVVLTGVRFPNELEMIHRFKGATWWIERPDISRVQEGSHESEEALKWEDFDLPIINDGSIGQLEYAAQDGLEFGRVEWMTAHDQMTEYVASTMASSITNKPVVNDIPVLTPVRVTTFLPEVSQEEFDRLEDLAEKQRTNLELARIKVLEEQGKADFLTEPVQVGKPEPIDISNPTAPDATPDIVDAAVKNPNLHLGRLPKDHAAMMKSVLHAVTRNSDPGYYIAPVTEDEQHRADDVTRGRQIITQRVEEAAPTITKTWEDLMSDMKAHHEA